jgi:hypothetical protein
MESGIFLAEGLNDPNQLEPACKFGLSAHAIFMRLSSRRAVIVRLVCPSGKSPTRELQGRDEIRLNWQRESSASTRCDQVDHVAKEIMIDDLFQLVRPCSSSRRQFGR